MGYKYIEGFIMASQIGCLYNLIHVSL